MADQLTHQQEMAVKNRGGKLLVSAAAGSGKTKVLVDRLLSYLTDPVSPANLDDFLIITYTKAAASELRGKIAAKLTERIAQEPENRHLQKQVQRLFLTHISTVHGFCTNLLREYAYRLDLSADFRVADEGECAELREQVLKDLLDSAYESLGTDEAFCAFVDTQGVGRNDGAVPEIIQQVYDSARCHQNPEGWLEKCLKNGVLDDTADISETDWGGYLMGELFSWLDIQIAALERYSAEAGSIPGMEKVSDNLDSAVSQLRWLRSSKSWDDVVNRKQIDFGRLVFPRKNPDEMLSEEIKALRNGCKEGLESRLKCFTNDSAQVVADMHQNSAAVAGLIALVRRFDQAYGQAKRSRHVLDFGDLEHKTLDLLVGKNRDGITAAAAEIGKRFREIMVDEYQDSNEVQDAIFSALTEQRQNCFMVGDVKQSIYRFRLADPGIFLNKYEQYANAENSETGKGRKILLSHNFRSGGEVIEGINDVFSFCMSEKTGGLNYGEAEALREGVPHPALPDPAVELYALETEEDTNGEEAAFTAGRIREMLQCGTMIRSGDQLRPVTPDDIVILLRSPGSVGGEYQHALEAVGIRCAVDGGMDLLETPEIGMLRSFLQTIANPRQDIPLLGALLSPVFGFTADDMALLRGENKKGCIYDALEKSGLPKARHFLEILSALREESRIMSLTKLMEQCFARTRLDSIYGAMPGGQAKRANLQMFYQLAADYEANGLRTLDQFLDYLKSMENSGLLASGSSTAGCVTIMSIHKSKGLEFPVVFLCNLARQFNQEDIRRQVLCDKKLGLGLCVTDNRNRIRYSSIPKRAIASYIKAESVSEEMRVLYVAMTRARDRLIMTYAAKRLEKQLENARIRLAVDGGRMLCAEAGCPGDWILAEALRRTEAGELHALGGIPHVTHLSKYPWVIRVIHSSADAQETGVLTEESGETGQMLPIGALELQNALEFRYPHQASIMAPSKQTATGRKGRIRDAEAAEAAGSPGDRMKSWRKPAFREKKKDGTMYGNAFHAAMQFIRYENCTDALAVDAEIKRMTAEGYLSEEYARLVDGNRIAAFFDSSIGRELVSGVPCIREFKFSILDNGEHYGEGLKGEQVLLQGVVDCALLKPEGIVILDFKTDYVTEDMLPEKVDRYRLQVETYAEALSRIYEMPVTEKYLYFFRLDRFVRI